MPGGGVASCAFRPHSSALSSHCRAIHLLSFQPLRNTLHKPLHQKSPQLVSFLSLPHTCKKHGGWHYSIPSKLLVPAAPHSPTSRVLTSWHPLFRATFLPLEGFL